MYSKIFIIFLLFNSCYSDKSQPSGFLNFSKLNNININKLKNENQRLIIYHIVPNIIRVSTGMIIWPDEPIRFNETNNICL